MRAPRTLAGRRLQAAAILGALLLAPRPAWTDPVAVLARAGAAVAVAPPQGLRATVTLDLDGGGLAATLVAEVLR